MTALTVPCEAIPGHSDFRRLDSIAGIAVDLRYATADNFVGRDLYSPLDCCWLHKDAAFALEQAVNWLAARKPEYKLLVLDALRPQRVQEQLWAALQGTDLLTYIADPTRGSIHSFGMALDLTLLDAQGQELDMGTGFDDLTERSHPALEEGLVAIGALSAQHIENRHWLRDAMLRNGWQGINTEWWHFDCGDRQHVRQHYIRVL
jgi:D-alanyl-D-alanine dipeptidase